MWEFFTFLFTSPWSSISRQWRLIVPSICNTQRPSETTKKLCGQPVGETTWPMLGIPLTVIVQRFILHGLFSRLRVGADTVPFEFCKMSHTDEILLTSLLIEFILVYPHWLVVGSSAGNSKVRIIWKEKYVRMEVKNICHIFIYSIFRCNIYVVWT